MRPRNLEEFVGQSHILSPGKLLWRIIKADKPSCLIFYGPPGTGKTSLARVIALSTQSDFLTINAVLGGVKDIREAIHSATRTQEVEQRRTILFIDEVHRFNKSQQDALLPHTENGTVIFIGATTENPYFEVNKALVSRSRVFELKSLSEAELKKALFMAVGDKERGLGNMNIELSEEAVNHWIKTSNGDARSLFNSLELAALSSPPDERGKVYIDLETAEESIQKKAALYDKDGDAHYDIISSFIKSMRGSDVDAALYWMARMVYAGEDPRFIFRRMVIFASEDVGMADPKALGVVMDAAGAFDYVGMPEGRFHLAQACIYLSTAKKSNTSFAFFDALGAVSQESEKEVPDHLKDGSRDKEGLNHGKGYLYPHAYKDHWVAQQYLPTDLMGRVFYHPTQQGYESEIAERTAEQRALQMEMLSESAKRSDAQDDYWEERVFSNQSGLLSEIKKLTVAELKTTPNSMILQLNSASGYLISDLIKKEQNQIVYAHVQNSEQLAIRRHIHASQIAEESFRIVNAANAQKALDLLSQHGFLFNLIVGKNVLFDQIDKGDIVEKLFNALAETGTLRLVESFPKNSPRISEMLEHFEISPEFVEQTEKIERELSEEPLNPKTNWDRQTLWDIFAEAGFAEIEIHSHSIKHGHWMNLKQLNQILLKNPKFGEKLEKAMNAEQNRRFRQEVIAKIERKKFDWKSSFLVCTAKKKSLA